MRVWIGIVILTGALVSGRPAESEADLEAVIVEAAPGDEGRQGREIAGIPTDKSGPGQAGFRLPLDDQAVVVEVDDLDAVVVEADLGDEGRSLDDIPVDDSAPGVAGFRLPLPKTKLRSGESVHEEEDFIVVVGDPSADDEVVIVEPSTGDKLIEVVEGIPRDISGPGKAGFRLPLPDSDLSQGRDLPTGEDIIEVVGGVPRDVSGIDKAGFRLPLADDDDKVNSGGRPLTREAQLDESDDDFVVVEAASDEDDRGRDALDEDVEAGGRILVQGGVPRDNTAGGNVASFRLPKPE